MVKRNEFKKRSRYLAMLTALSLAFSNIGSCVNMVYAAETQEQEDGAAEEPEENNEDAGEEAEGEEEEAEENSGSEEENSGDDSENDSENDSEEGGSEEENAEDENSGDENGGDENSGEEGGNSEEDGEDSESGKDTGDSEDKDEKDAENHEEGESGKENGGQSGSEEDNNSETEKDSVSAGGSSSSGNSKSAVKEADEAKKGTYKLTYSVDPDEGAVVEGPSSVAAGKNAVFTVEAQEGYVIKNVSCDGGEISTVEDVDTASASNAQKKNAGKNDGEKFQTYQIENVTEDSEIIIEMDNEDLSVYEAEDSTQINGVTITAKWNTKESGISADAKLHVEEVTEQSRDKVTEGIQAGEVAQLNPEEDKIQDVIVYDITLADADTVYSAWADGTVLVTFTGAEIEEKIAQADKVSVLHVDEAENKLTQVAAEDVAGETGAEVSFEAEHFSQYAVAFTKTQVKAADATVTPDMSSEDIQNIINDSKNAVIAFSKGEYKDMALTIPAGRDITIVPEEEVKFAYTSAKNAFELKAGSSLTIGNGTEATLEIEGASNGIYAYNIDGDAKIAIAENTRFYVHDSVAKVGEPLIGNGISLNGKGDYYLTAEKGSTVELVNNKAGIYTYGAEAGTQSGPIGVLKATFTGCTLLNLSDNTTSSGIQQGDGYYMNAEIIIDGCQEVKMNNNGVDAICVNAGATLSLIRIKDCPFVEMNENGSWGTNGGDIEIINSVVDISRNSDNPWARVTYTSSNLYAESLKIQDSTVTANHCGANSGIWVESSAYIENSTIYANDNGLKCYGNYNRSDKPYYCGDYPWNTGNGLALCGAQTQIINSTIYAQGNGGSGIAFASTDENGNVLVDNSKLYADKNGISENIGASGEKVNNAKVNVHDAIHFSGIAVIKGIVEVRDSVISATENARYGISYHDLYNGKLMLDGETVARVQTNSDILKGEIRTADFTNKKQDTVVINGSLQGNRDNMTGEYTLNTLKASDEIYTAPVNIYGTKLTRFNLHGSKNLEVGDSMAQEFEYLDPNVNETVAYSFRYNTAEEDLNGTGGNAYVWAPVSVLHYDATEGKINAFGTAVQGNAALLNTRGDGSVVGNAGYAEEASDRYATDYTIFGNSMNLTEGELPAAVRDGYKFAGWYVADNEGAARDYAASGNWAELNKLLNTRFMADSKVSEDITDVSKGQEEKTIYAKWVLLSQYNIVINYIDERTGAHITASYNSDYMEEGSSYDVASLLNRTFDGYTWIRYEGGQAAGSLNSDLVFNVYYNSNTPAPTPGNGGGSGSSGGGSSSGSRGSIITDNGGPGVTIQDENVPLAELPSEALPQEAVSIPEEDVPLAALPKTGQSAGKEIALFVSALVLGAAGLFGKRTKED